MPRRPAGSRLVRGPARIGVDRPRTCWRTSLASPVTIPDQWQVQIQARVQAKAHVLLKADGLSDGQLRAAHLEPIADVSGTLRGLLAAQPAARVCVLPQGPQTIWYV